MKKCLIILALLLTGFTAGIVIKRYVNPNTYLQNFRYTCKREEPYDMEPEFDRAFSLIQQRFANVMDVTTEEVKGLQEKAKKERSSVLNCLSIEYSDLEELGAEGVFFFNARESNPQKLTIYVDNSYKNRDDLFTAMLLSHELTHVYQYNMSLLGKDTQPCIEQEVQAFNNQLYFFETLKLEEKNSILSNLEDWKVNKQPNISESLNSTYSINYSLIYEIYGGALLKCEEMYEHDEVGYSKCTSNQVLQEIRNMVNTIPAYQEQCNSI